MDMKLFEKQNDIVNLHVRFINLVVRSGRSITRWRRCNNICIPNIPGCIDINKFRNIHIYECDLNAILAIKWRNAIQKAEDEMKLCEIQFGSRKTKTSQLPILIEISNKILQELQVKATVKSTMMQKHAMIVFCQG
jgi:hypothetical protein